MDTLASECGQIKAFLLNLQPSDPLSAYTAAPKPPREGPSQYWDIGLASLTSVPGLFLQACSSTVFL